MVDPLLDSLEPSPIRQPWEKVDERCVGKLDGVDFEQPLKSRRRFKIGPVVPIDPLANCLSANAQKSCKVSRPQSMHAGDPNQVIGKSGRPRLWRT